MFYFVCVLPGQLILSSPGKKMAMECLGSGVSVCLGLGPVPERVEELKDILKFSRSGYHF